MSSLYDILSYIVQNVITAICSVERASSVCMIFQRMTETKNKLESKQRMDRSKAKDCGEMRCKQNEANKVIV